MSLAVPVRNICDIVTCDQTGEPDPSLAQFDSRQVVGELDSDIHGDCLKAPLAPLGL